MVELDERVDEGHSDEDSTEISVGKIVLNAKRLGKNSMVRRTAQHLEIDTQESIFQDASNHEQDVEHGHEAIEILRGVS